MGRKLASVQIVKELRAIPNADRLEVAKIQGWECVVEKGKYKVGDSVIFVEIDSLVPLEERYKFLEKYCSIKTSEDGKTGYRIKTARLRGQISQGLVMPSELFEGLVICDKPEDITENQDVTELLGISLYNPPIPANMKGLVKGAFPSFIPKTDETRCLSKDTIVKTDIGNKTIKEICDNRIKCNVLSFNINTNKLEFKEIIGYNVSKNNYDWYEIVTENTILKATSNHLVWIPLFHSYKAVSELKKGDILERN